ncbi:hypothetical protein PCANC_25326 [Puccinia coronata f. sp. avenae]|uniref:Uncharacterized protein n=1 Tax=Puccinia coronata f. sp. avenae TaxID=200324 RepID=A0A2N5SH87_9BASI|nr:hypothetical protein PCANC_25326 [Puccinia coronata f. sp. avenae]PLW30930.1 hypothetical protein PCASD_20453 [Puccinia coronata f. sp. avenae]
MALPRLDTSITQVTAQELPTPAADDIPPGGISSGNFQPYPQGSSLPGRSAAPGSQVPSVMTSPGTNVAPLPTPKQSSQAPSAPGGSSDSSTQLRPGPSDSSSTASIPSNKNDNNSPAPGIMSGAAPEPITKDPISGKPTSPASLPNPTSNALPSNASQTANTPSSNSTQIWNTIPSNSSQTTSHDQSSIPPGSGEKSRGALGKPTENQKTAIVVSSVVLGALLILGVMLVLMKQQRNKRPMSFHSHERVRTPSLQARPGEFGKRGTVLAGRGLETSHGLPSSGGWLDNRRSEVAPNARSLSISTHSNRPDLYRA